MITKMINIPDHVAGFTAIGEVTKDDYTQVVNPEIERVLSQHGHIHFLLELQTGTGNFTAGAWMSDALIGLKHLTKWKKMAIVSDQKAVEKITDIISPIMPGETKGFSLSELEAAKQWVSSETD